MAIDLKKLFLTDSTINDKFSLALVKALKGSAQPGFDYIKFKQSVQTMSDMNMDIETSFKSAFATASTMGLTKTKLSQSVKFYKKVLEKERSKFAEALENQMDTRVSKKKEEALKLQDRIKEYQQKIAKMQQEMEAYQHKIDNVDTEMAQAKEKIDKTKNEFLTAYDQLTSTLNEDIEQITSHL